MKLLLLTFFILPFATQAQDLTIDPALQQVVTDALPAKYASYTSLALIALMWLGRAIPVLQQGSGIVGWFKAILFGTNTPKN